MHVANCHQESLIQVREKLLNLILKDDELQMGGKEDGTVLYN